jgi:hypothetical protein
VLYTMELHGVAPLLMQTYLITLHLQASLRSLYRQCSLATGPCVLLCMDTWSYIFGVLTSQRI